MKEFYTLQPEDSANVTTKGSFKIKHPTLNKYWSLDSALTGCGGSALRLNSGTETTFTLDKKSDIFTASEGWGGLKTSAGKYIRHCGYVMWDGTWTPNNFDFAWVLYKQADGKYQIFNPYPGASTPGTYVGYDAAADRVLIVNPGDSKIVNWVIEYTTPSSTTSSSPGSPASSPGSPATSSDSSSSDSGGLPGWAIALIVIFILLILGGGVAFAMKKKAATV